MYAGSTEVATGETAAASSVYSATYSADKANDGNTGTRWASALTPGSHQWWKVNLPTAQTITKVRILPSQATTLDPQIPKKIMVQYSSDNTNFSDLQEFGTANATGWQEFLLTAIGKPLIYGGKRPVQFGGLLMRN